MLLTSMARYVREFERQSDRLPGRAAAQGSGAVMPMDGIRRKDDVVLRFDLPGTDPDSIEVTVDRGVLSVSAKREEEYSEDERVFVRERVMGTFTRRVYLSEHLHAEAIEAAYNNGVLGARIPVLERATPRNVEIEKTAQTHKA